MWCVVLVPLVLVAVPLALARLETRLLDDPGIDATPAGHPDGGPVTTVGGRPALSAPPARASATAPA